MHIHRRDLAVAVGRVVIDPFIGVAAAGIDRYLTFALLQPAAAARLLHRAQNVEKLPDALPFIPRYRQSPLQDNDLPRHIPLPQIHPTTPVPIPISPGNS